jgi:hypothetical protein
MKRILLLLACLGALSLTACTSDSALPDPTGEGAIRAINAIKGSPEIRFLIEERTLQGLTYKDASTPSLFDDFEYNFNFEILFPGDTETTRVATVLHKVEANREHTFVLTGDIQNPTITLWNADLREWTETDTVFEVRVAHLLESRAAESVDIYIDEAVTPAVVANRVATVAYGEVSTVQDLAEGEYIITITAANDVNTVLFTSSASVFAARTSQLAVAFDGDANDTSSIVVTVVSAGGGERRLVDASASPTVRFINASYPLSTVDIYDDDVLTNRIVAGLAHGDASARIDVSGDLETYYFTPADSTATILFEGGYDAFSGVHANVIMVGAVDEWLLVAYQPDNAAVDLYAKLRVAQTSLDNDTLNVYLLTAGETITDESVPLLNSLTTPGLSGTLNTLAGSYDIFLTAPDDQTPIAGPFRLDPANGDAIDLFILDTADPAVPELLVLPAP